MQKLAIAGKSSPRTGAWTARARKAARLAVTAFFVWQLAGFGGDKREMDSQKMEVPNTVTTQDSANVPKTKADSLRDKIITLNSAFESEIKRLEKQSQKEIMRMMEKDTKELIKKQKIKVESSLLPSNL